jgi:hypothetical protein
MNRAVEDEDVSMFIRLTNICQAMNALPRSGGVLDQDSYLIYGMELVLNAQAERRRLEDQREADRIRSQSPKVRKH